MFDTIQAVFNWIAERIQDLFRWPVNLVRDFPRRLRRLVVTLWVGLYGFFLFVRGFNDKSKRGDTWWADRIEGAGFWWHRLFSELFDLVGGPELGEFVLRMLANSTPLTGEEIAKVTAVFGPHGLRFGDVRVAQDGLLEHLIFRFNGNLAFATWHTIHLPRTGHHTRESWPLVMHELTHVYQYEHVGTRYLGEAIYMLIKTKRDCYNYGFIEGLAKAATTGKLYQHHNREQQAMIVQDYVALEAVGRDTAVYQPFLTQLRAGQL